jgi:hypothetical protein
MLEKLATTDLWFLRDGRWSPADLVIVGFMAVTGWETIIVPFLIFFCRYPTKIQPVLSGSP